MMTKKSFKIISVLLIAVLAFSFLGTTVFANQISTSEGTISSGFTPNVNAISGSSEAKTTVATILGAIKWIGIAVSVAMLMFIGIKYVTSSPEGKANIKGILGTYVLGFALIVFATTIVGILETALK